VSLNRRASNVNLVLEKRKPFDLLVERPLLNNSRGDRRPTFPYEFSAESLMRAAFAQSIDFTVDAFVTAEIPSAAK